MATIKEKSQSIFGVMFGLIFLAVLLVLPALLIFGVNWLGEIILPWLVVIGVYAAVGALVLLAPLLLIPPLRNVVHVGFDLLTFYYGVTTALMAIVCTIDSIGVLWVFVGIFLGGLPLLPIALVGTAIAGHWFAFVMLIATAAAVLLAGLGATTAEMLQERRVARALE